MRYNRHKKKSRVRWVVLGTIFFLVFLIGILAWYTESGRFDLEEVTVTGTGFIAEDAVRDIVEKEATSKWLFFSRDNWLLYPRERTIGLLQANLAAVGMVELEVDSKSVQISIKEREPQYLWCPTKCFFIDAEGVAFAEAPAFQGATYVKLHKEGVTDKLGMQFLPSETITEIRSLVEALAGIEFQVQEVRFIGDRSVRVMTRQGIEISLSLEQDYIEIMRTIVAVLEKEKDIASIRSIDARIDHKVFIIYR